MNLLHVDSGILGTSSVSRRLSAAAVAQWRERHPETNVVYRDLVSDPIDHLTGDLLAAQRTGERSPAIRDTLAVGAKVLEEFLAADVRRKDISLHRKRTDRLSRRKDSCRRILARGLLR